MRRGAASQLPRHIRIESHHIGDTIKVEWATGELIKTVTATIAKREYEGAFTVLYTKPSLDYPHGNEIVRYNSQLTHRFKVTLLNSAPTRDQPTLFDVIA